MFSFLLPPRRGFGSNQRPDNSSLPREPKHGHPWSTKPGVSAHQDSALFKQDQGVVLGIANPVDSPSNFSLPPSGPNPTSTYLQPPIIFTPDGGVGDLPRRTQKSTARHSRSSFTGFFAFSSRRKSTHGPPILQFQQEHLAPPSPNPGRWLPGKLHTEVVIDRSIIPSPFRTDEEEYYYSYYGSLTPTSQSHPASPRLEQPGMLSTKQPSLRQQDHIGNQDLDSQASSPVDYHPPHTQLSHPYAYSSPLPNPAYEPQPAHPLRHVASEQIQPHPPTDRARAQSSAKLTHNRMPPSAASHDVCQSQSSFTQPPLKTSISTPNLASVAAFTPRKPASMKKSSQGSKGERWLSAETWWDALFSPSPRFKVRQVPRRDADVDGNARAPKAAPVDAQLKMESGAPLSSVATGRPRAASSASHAKPERPTLTKSRSAADLLSNPPPSAFPSAGFEPALELLTDEGTPMTEQNPSGDAELPLPEPPLSLAQVIDEGEALDQQRARWKLQASKSLGNKHTRSLSRARSKSLSERHVRGQHHSESAKNPSHLEFLAARTLLGSQSTMPTVHFSHPSGTSAAHSKPISHSHSHSAFSNTHTHTSHSHTYSHSHSHSLTTSNSSKSSRNPPQRGHSRNGSWGKTALLKAGALCGVGQNDSYVAPVDEKVNSSSRVADVPATSHLGDPVEGDRTTEEANRKVSPSPSVPSGEVGIAISSPAEGCRELTIPDHPYASTSGRTDGGENIQDDHRTSRHTHKSSEYAGPHRSTMDLKLPHHVAVNDVSLRHRLPPRAVVQLPIGPISHPYASTSAVARTPDRRQRSGSSTLQVTEARSVMEQNGDRSFLPHISLSQSDFERYGVGEALVFACPPRPEDIMRGKERSTKGAASPEFEPPSLPPSPSPLPIPQRLHVKQSPSFDTVVLAPEDPEPPSPSELSNPASLTTSTIHMVMSAFDNPDDLDEFQDLFYKPQVPTVGQHVPEQVTSDIPTDVHGSTKSPLDKLVRSLSEEMQGQHQGIPHTPSDPARLQNSGSQMGDPSNEDGKFVFMDLAREYSSSPLPMEPGTPVQVPIRKESEPAVQPISSVPEDVTSSGASVLEAEENENDTFGYSNWHGHLQVATAPAPAPTPMPRSAPSHLHLSVVDTAISRGPSRDAERDEQADQLSPVRSRYGFSSADAVRSSYMTTSDVSRMSGLSDFPLPPTVRPGGHFGHASVLHAYLEGNSSESDGRSRERPMSTDESHYEDEDEQDEDDDDDERLHGEEDDDGDWDRHRREGAVEETLPVPRSTMRVRSYESHRTTFGGSEDMDFITQLHNVGP